MTTPERHQRADVRKEAKARGCGTSILVIGIVLGAIVVVLGSIIATASAPIRARAGAAGAEQECREHLRVIAGAALAYARSNGGILPDYRSWPQQLSAYGVSQDTLKCPADKSRSVTSYAMDPRYGGTRLSDYPDAYSRVLFYDADEQGRAAPRHRGRINYAYMDGHVKTTRGVVGNAAGSG